MPKRPKGYILPGKGKGTARRNDNTRVLTGGRKKVRVLTSEASKNVGRPGFKGKVAGPVDGKTKVRRVMQRDPSRGNSLPLADKITNTKVDLIGPVNPRILSQTDMQYVKPNAGKKVIRPPRKSLPVSSNKPGRVRRGPR